MPVVINNLKDLIDTKIKKLLSVTEDRKELEAQEDKLRMEILQLCKEENLKTFSNDLAKVTIAKKLQVKVANESDAIAHIDKVYTDIIPEHVEINTKKITEALNAELLQQEDLIGFNISQSDYLVLKPNKQDKEEDLF
jgi:hypothetical protein